MVLAERQSEILRNGRRSRGPSPNGHNNGTPDTSSDDDNSIKRNGKSKKQSEYEEKIRVGRDYQAVCPELVPTPDRKPELLNDRALLVWSPTKEIPDTKLEEYISVAKEKYGYNGEQALGMLFWHKHDLERAVMDLANFTPFPDEWTVEDKVLFEQAFQFHGKSFHRIRQMLPDKSIASLVKYYYSWKKTRHRQSVMDRQEKAKASKDGSENGSDNGSNEESETEDKVQYNKQQISTLKRKISECSEDLRPIEIPNRINARWTQEELTMAVLGVKTFGKDFQAIADTLGTKTETHIRTFFVNYRRRYNLDNVLKEYETARDANSQKDESQQIPKDDNNKIDIEVKLTTDKMEQDLDKNITQKNIVDIIEIDGGQTNDSTTTAPTTIISTTTTPSSIVQSANKSLIITTSTITTSQSTPATNTTTDIISSINELQSQKKQSKNQENIIMEIDLDSETSEPSPPKKLAPITTSTGISKELIKATTTA